MKELLSLARQLFRSPWTYLYWAIATAGIIAAHLNSGLSGSPVLGAASIASTLLCMALFYFHLNHLRNSLGFPQKRTAFGLFLSIYAYRLRLLLLLSPLFALLFLQGTFGRLAGEYLNVTLAPPAEKFGEFLSIITRFWLLAITVVAFFILDLAGRAHVVARGGAKKALRLIPETFRKAALPLAALIAAYLALFSVQEYFAFIDYVNWKNITPALAVACVLVPVEYGLQIVSVLYLAKRVKPGNPEA
jgi:hypothetical protein